MLAAGHELGNHSWTHPHLDSIRVDSMRVELARTDSLLRALGVARPHPAASALRRVRRGRCCASWRRRHRIVALFDVDPSYDFPWLASSDSIVAKTVRLARAGVDPGDAPVVRHRRRDAAHAAGRSSTGSIAWAIPWSRSPSCCGCVTRRPSRRSTTTRSKSGAISGRAQLEAWREGFARAARGGRSSRAAGRCRRSRSRTPARPLPPAAKSATR